MPPGVTKCPVCATELQKVITRRKSEKGGGLALSDDYLRKELPRIELPKTKVACPICAMELQGGEAKCPRCGIPLTSDRDMLECPECGALAPPGAESCPNCGVGFEEAPSAPTPPPVEEIPPPPEPPVPPVSEPEPEPEAVTVLPAGVATKTEGLVNGRGAVNGTGLVNGRGAVNGTGLVNGTGITNGTKGGGRVPAAAKRQTMLTRRWQFLAVLVAVAIVIPTFIYLSYSQETPVSIDGHFDEWKSVQKFGVYSLAGSAPVNVDQWAVHTQGSKVYMYVKAQADIMGSTNVNGFYLFVDSDGSPATGYNISGAGADYLLQLEGWNGTVHSTSLCEYASAANHYDWNSWNEIGSLSSYVSGNQLEAMAELPSAPGPDARFLLMSKDNLDRSSVSYAVPEKGGVLIVRQEQGPAVQSNGVVASAVSLSVLRLTLTCQGEGGTVESLTPTVVGASIVSTFQETPIAVGQERVFDVLVDTSSSAPGTLIRAFISEDRIISTFFSVEVVGMETRAYVASAPSSIQIDGAFGDWIGRTVADTDALPVGNPDIDISAVGAVNDSASSFFYVSVVGEMCGGSYVPMVLSKPSGGGGGGIIIPTEKTGEDVLRVYIDSDLSLGTGFPVSSGTKTIGADYKAEVRGLNGEIKSTALYLYSAGQWSAVLGSPVHAANDYNQLEMSIASSSISGSTSMDYVVETTDWRARTDVATSTPTGTRALSSTLASSPGMDRWIVESPTTSSSATAMSYQRKLFYDGTNFWSFFWDGANTVYKYSVDNGSTWTSVGSVFKTTGVNEVSIWYDSANSIVYAVGDTSASTRNVNLQRGTVSPATHTITWAGTDRTLAASQNNLGSKNTFISKDASGYVWVMSSNFTSAGPPAQFDLSVFRSSSADSITSFVYMGNMLTTDTGQPNLKGSILPAGSGQNMWAIYGYAGNVAARKYTGIWSAETLIFTLTLGLGNPGNTDNAPPCAAVDGSGVVHVVYGDDHEQPSGTSKPFIYYVYNTGSSWSVPYRLDSVANTLGNLYPTVSIDSSTGAVYAFWIQMDTAGIGRTIMGKKNVSGTWSALAFDPQTGDPKQYLTSIYSVSGETHICWQWTQNTTAPIQIVFDKIPEFHDAVVPILFVLLVVVASARHSRRRRCA